MMILLSDSQLDRLSEFVANLGLVFFASAITPLFTGIDKTNFSIILLGLAMTVSCLIISLFLLKGVEK